MRKIRFFLKIEIPANQIRAQMHEDCVTRTPDPHDVAIMLRDSNRMCLAASGVIGAAVEIVQTIQP